DSTMSVESRMPHLNDEQMLDAYFSQEDAAHLDACADCLARFDALARVMDQVHDDAVGEADAVFTLDRLHAQRDRVMRRLERQGPSAVVLILPSHYGSRASS